MTKLKTKKYAVIQWYTQAGNLTIGLKVNLYLTFPEFRAMKIVTWEFHVDESSKGRYHMILGGYQLTTNVSSNQFMDI